MQAIEKLKIVKYFDRNYPTVLLKATGSIFDKIPVWYHAPVTPYRSNMVSVC
jgi:hypothetical protein